MQERTRRPEQRPRKYGPSQVAELTAVRASELGVFLDAETGNTSDDILLHTVQQTAPVKIGDRVRVATGPLTGMEGPVTEISPGKGKVKFSANVFGHDTEIEMDYAELEKL